MDVSLHNHHTDIYSKRKYPRPIQTDYDNELLEYRLQKTKIDLDYMKDYYTYQTKVLINDLDKIKQDHHQNMFIAALDY